MSNYTKSTNFATKDNLTPGDPLKVVRGTEIDTEFNNIATAVATKTDNASAAITGGSITGITDLAVADGGTGASTAAGALNNLLPSQASAANKYLQSDGTNASWDAVTLSTADITGTLPVANGGTGVTSSTGTGSVVLSNSPTLVTPALGTPASGTLTNATGLPISTGVSGLGTGVATFLGTPSSANLASAVTDETGSGALVFANSPTLVTPALGTPSALVGTNITGTASGLTAGNVTTNANLTGAVTSVGNASSLGSFTSSQLATALSDETGSGSAVFATSPTLVTPILGTPTSATLTNATGLPIATGVSGLGTGVATFLATPSSANLAAALTDETGSGANVFATSPTLVTPILGTPTSATLTNATGLPLTTGVTGTLPTANGGTNLTSFTSGGVVYASSSSALATSSLFTWDAANLVIQNASGAGFYINGNSTSIPNINFYNTTSNQVRGFIKYDFAAEGMLFAASGSEQMRLTSTGLGIGTSSPLSKVDARAASATMGNYQTIQAFSTDTSAAVDLGGGISLGGFYNSTQIAQFGSIVGRKENGTSGNYAGYLAFGTNAQATGVVERARISSDGTFRVKGAGTAGSTDAFQVSGSAPASAASIDSSGNVGIGLSNPTYRLDIEAPASGSASMLRLYNPVANSNPHLRIQNDAQHFTLQVVGARSDNFEIADSTAGSSINEVRMSILSGSGNVIFGKNIGIGATTPTTSGTGITFPATQSASSDANTLDDYEEGTWTPTVISTTGTNPTVTYSNQYGYYVKVGRMVHINMYLTATAITGGTGWLTVGGLPFNTDSSTASYGAIAVAGIDSIPMSGGETQYGLRVSPGGTTMLFLILKANTAENIVDLTGVSQGGVTAGGTYISV